MGKEKAAGISGIFQGFFFFQTPKSRRLFFNSSRARGISPEALCITIITHSELCYGMALVPERKRQHAMTRTLLKRIPILPYCEGASHTFAGLKAQLRNDGNLMGTSINSTFALNYFVTAVLESARTHKYAYVSALLVPRISLRKRVFRGTLMPDLDLMIASIALFRKLPLVTNNMKDFGRIRSLECINWMKS